ncbi:MAG TPA: hypothetical protein VGC17_00040 [Lactovum miscens]
MENRGAPERGKSSVNTAKIPVRFPNRLNVTEIVALFLLPIGGTNYADNS